MRITFYTILLFLFIYSIPIYGPFNTSYLSSFIALLLCLINSKAYSSAQYIYKSKFFWAITIVYLYIIVHSILVAIASESYDYVIVKTWVNNLISLLSSALFVSLYTSYFEKKYRFEQFLFYVLIIQSIYIIIAIIFPDMSEKVQALIRTQDQIDRMSIYGGVRGVALSGSLAFGLAITMTLLGFFSTIWLIKFSTINFLLKICFFFICLLASLSAGRTAILGFAFAIIYCLPTLINLRNIFRLLIIVPTFIVLLLFIYETNESIQLLIDKYSAYVFEPIIAFLNTGSFKVSSLKTLESMYFLPPLDTLIIGDAKYVDEVDPSLYYMGTDSGYMRFILFYGLLGSIIPYISFIIVISLAMYKSNFIVLFLVILMSFILQYKGEVIFFAVSYMKIVFCVLFYYLKGDCSKWVK